MNGIFEADSTGWFDAGDGTKLFLRRWIPEAPKAVLHIVHGMAEHSLRYGRLARQLNENGVEVWAADQRGHGKTADTGVNDPAKGGILGHCADEDGFSRVTADIDLINRKIREERPGLSLFLLGHSWGSFIVQNYLETFAAGNAAHTENAAGAGSTADAGNAARAENAAGRGRIIDGCILSGTRGPGGFKIRAGVPFMAFLAFVLGKRRPSPLARIAVDGSCNRPFRPNRTSFDWLSRDENEVDAYVNDPACGNLCSAGFYRDLASGLKRIHNPANMEKIDRDLPVYIFSGSADPVGDMGVSTTVLVTVYRSMGMKDLEFVLYPDARHETFNETNREEVTENLVAWMLKHCEN
ncbi:MAG: lysophospholipase [Treponema sp.]|jgi:alpha-beta hydrolase superfamily lysophospholipase|nr:lysophospholipase [Treponema sp.]